MKLAKKDLYLTIPLGIASGVPLLAIGSTLQAWLHDAEISLELIGALSLLGLPYSFKFLWAPLLDRYEPPFLGRRRGWILIAQLLLSGLFLLLSTLSPAESPTLVGVVAFFIACASATQDTVIDAHRRDILSPELFGLGNGLFVNGYRIGMLLSGAVALSLADAFSWEAVYQCISAVMLLTLIGTVLSSEPEVIGKPRSITQAFQEPLKAFITKDGWVRAILFVLLFKVGDSLASAMTTPYLLEVGYSKTEIGVVAKTVGLFATLGGGLIGGYLLTLLSLRKGLFIFGILQSGTTALFILLLSYPSELSLSFVIGLENIASGMGTAAFVTVLGLLCDARFSATQYALLSSIASVPRVVIGSFAGVFAVSFGWCGFFLFCTVIAIPGLLLVPNIAALFPEKER